MTEANLLVGQRILARRKELGVTATALANQIGISQQQLSRYERGTNRINLSHLIAICALLDTPISWFFIDCFSDDEAEKKNKVSSHVSVEDTELKERFEQIWPRLSYKQHRTLILFLDEHLKA
ncbi:helix-turn-helix domain-containing protein [Xenorhabdus bovienii]|uniref:helix-turn-helix domain-containing protein n=1 Tax=Xenorhabdus bovienii TaxID=40576 RepID=UPI0023B2DA16|nr:helix-turn-helix transcriptional regulator [Xenorhabdus bovienii]MDE9456067.1 helix-turn-helix domain-containing protein [Xenorhabdus bovienii]MDE9553210.1 helix-turn-helix domain-containing protein [Xenorhabdus bovienii]MDE9557601.1 helix-turn-helix domain-containing protein [Xenorhabdus bovienii]